MKKSSAFACFRRPFLIKMSFSICILLTVTFILRASIITSSSFYSSENPSNNEVGVENMWISLWNYLSHNGTFDVNYNENQTYFQQHHQQQQQQQTLKHIFQINSTIMNLSSSSSSSSFSYQPSLKSTERTCDNRARILIAVLSKRQDFDQRKHIRESWGECIQWGKTPLQVGFFIGATQPFLPNSTEEKDYLNEEKLLMNEQKQFHDLIMDSSYIDHYQNLTLKVLSIMKWTYENCENVKILMKVDSDAILFVDRLIIWLQKNIPNVNLSILFGNLMSGGRVIRIKSSKWFVPVSEYGKSHFPSYIAGPVYGMTRLAIKQLLLQNELYVKAHKQALHIEDAYITGILFQESPKNSIERIKEKLFCTMNCHLHAIAKVICAHELFISGSRWRSKYESQLTICNKSFFSTIFYGKN